MRTDGVGTEVPATIAASLRDAQRIPPPSWSRSDRRWQTWTSRPQPPVTGCNRPRADGADPRPAKGALWLLDLGRVEYGAAYAAPAPPAGRARRRAAARPAAAGRAPAGHHARAAWQPRRRLSDRRRARRARHRHLRDESGRPGHLPRARPDRRLPDHPPARHRRRRADLRLAPRRDARSRTLAGLGHRGPPRRRQSGRLRRGRQDRRDRRGGHPRRDDARLRAQRLPEPRRTSR